MQLRSSEQQTLRRASPIDSHDAWVRPKISMLILNGTSVSIRDFTILRDGGQRLATLTNQLMVSGAVREPTNEFPDLNRHGMNITQLYDQLVRRFFICCKCGSITGYQSRANL